MTTTIPVPDTFSVRVAQLDTARFKNIPIERHQNFREFTIAQEAIKKYIQTRNCILYGGIAIDYALRLRGDKIYEDTDIPDFDFWVPDNVASPRARLRIYLLRLFPIRISTQHAPNSCARCA